MPESNTQNNSNPPSESGKFQGAIEINSQSSVEIDRSRIVRVVSQILVDAGYTQGTISIAIVSDPVIHRLNKQFLNHDYETDVLSFTLDAKPQRGWLEGEIVASIDTATRVAAGLGWPADDELLLYIIHGCLHLTGKEDGLDGQRAEMRMLENRYLQNCGLVPPPEKDHPS